MFRLIPSGATDPRCTPPLTEAYDQKETLDTLATAGSVWLAQVMAAGEPFALALQP